MIDILVQSVFPFILSALIVIIITVIAENFGTKVGGILGTIPSTIIVAFLFIALNRGEVFASNAAAVVPAELGVNVIFLLLFAMLAHRSIILAFVMSLAVWSFLSALLMVFDVTNISLSIVIYVLCFVLSFTFLEHVVHVPSQGKVAVHYTPMKIALRGLLAGIIITISVLLSNVSDVLSGIFSVFPAILSSTMLISVREHGPSFASGMAKSMIFGISSVGVYATSIHFLYPVYGVTSGTIVAFCISLLFTLLLFSVRKKLR